MNSKYSTLFHSNSRKLEKSPIEEYSYFDPLHLPMTYENRRFRWRSTTDWESNEHVGTSCSHNMPNHFDNTHVANNLNSYEFAAPKLSQQLSNDFKLAGGPTESSSVYSKYSDNAIFDEEDNESVFYSGILDVLEDYDENIPENIKSINDQHKSSLPEAKKESDNTEISSRFFSEEQFSKTPSTTVSPSTPHIKQDINFTTNENESTEGFLISTKKFIEQISQEPQFFVTSIEEEKLPVKSAAKIEKQKRKRIEKMKREQEKRMKRIQEFQKKNEKKKRKAKLKEKKKKKVQKVNENREFGVTTKEEGRSAFNQYAESLKQWCGW